MARLPKLRFQNLQYLPYSIELELQLLVVSSTLVSRPAFNEDGHHLVDFVVSPVFFTHKELRVNPQKYIVLSSLMGAPPTSVLADQLPGPSSYLTLSKCGFPTILLFFSAWKKIRLWEQMNGIFATGFHL